MDKFWWFEGESVRQLARRLHAHPNARLEVRIDSQEAMTFRVVRDDSDVVEEDINFSHVCPPVCPS